MWLQVGKEVWLGRPAWAGRCRPSKVMLKVVALIQGNRDPQPTMSLRLVTPRNTGASLEEEIASWRC